MGRTSYIIAAKRYYALAKEVEAEMETAQDKDIIAGLRMVTGQNYFYALVSAIDATLSSANVRVENHRDRERQIQLHHTLFKNADMLKHKYSLLIGEEGNYRIKVAYRGENGNKFKTVKEAAVLGMQELEYVKT